jgi:hypothetical protein
MSDTTNPPPPEPTPPPPKKNNYAWIGYFAFLIIASVGVAAFMIWFNLQQQLTREKLEAAEKLWNEKGPKSYRLVYTKQIQGEKLVTFAVTVRDKQVTQVLMNGEALKKNAEQTDDPKIYHSMEAQFLAIRRFMDLDEKPGAAKVYVVANFDPQTGAVQRYIRRVMGSNERVELNFAALELLKD